jgi:hypothetical protein
LLVQLPPDQVRDDDRPGYFLRGLPEWMRVAVELRQRSWAVDPVFEVLSRHHATYLVSNWDQQQLTHLASSTGMRHQLQLMRRASSGAEW